MNDFEKVMIYFPPVNQNIENLYIEAENSYKLYNSTSPLKQINIKGEIYSPDILSNLRTLRILLNSNLSKERFIYELNRLVEAWGVGGVYNKNILNSSLVDLISKINLKYEKELEFIKEAERVSTEYDLNQLEDDMKSVSIKNKPSKKLNIKDLDLEKIGLNTFSINKKTITKKKNNKINNKKN
jgi:hypothetical protein